VLGRYPLLTVAVPYAPKALRDSLSRIRELPQLVTSIRDHLALYYFRWRPIQASRNLLSTEKDGFHTALPICHLLD
jgi:hypothetical protein